MWGWIWWKREHAALSCAMCGLVLARSRPRWALLVVPWVALAARHRGYTARGLARSASELPGRALIDGAEIVTMACGSVRFRTLLL